MTTETVPASVAHAMCELEKIERYFGMAAEKWEDDPGAVQGREFFIDWELSTLPEAFMVSGPVAIAATVLSPAHDDMIASISWNTDEEQADITFECDELRQQWLIQLSDDEPIFHEQSPEVLHKEEISYGERLEFIYDLLNWCQQHQPFWRVRELGREQYSAAIDGIAADYPKTTVALMRRASMRNVANLIANAAQDMADDELSNQLTLPLGGTYSAAVGRNVVDLGLPATRPEQETPGAILRGLRFLHQVIAAVAEADEAILLSLDDAVVLGERGYTWTLRIPLPNHKLNIVEGARFRVQAPGERKPIGRLSVDVRERDSIVAHVDWDGPPYFASDGLKTAGLRAEAPRSPHRFVRDEIQALHQRFFQTGSLSSPALEAALGLSGTIMPAVTIGEQPDFLDPTQRLAWCTSIQDDRTLALIQGPPGTGKTHVLEKTLRTLVENGKRVLLIAPSHAAVDNICRRILDLPIMRLGRSVDRISPDVAPVWVEDSQAVSTFIRKRGKSTGSVYAGTPLGLLRAPLVNAELDKNGLFDVLVVDEAGMAPVGDFLLCARLVKRAVLYGDHQQLPPFPLEPEIERSIRQSSCALPEQWLMVSRSALEWLATTRALPIVVLRTSYRCQNPRLMRFSSVLFYDAAVRASTEADYFQLSWEQRQAAYPAATLRLYDTSPLEPRYKHETLSLDGGRPGIENRLEAAFCCGLVYRLLRRFPLTEVSLIAPYRRQVRLIRKMLSKGKAAATAATPFSAAEWEQFLHNRVATVDSFQGNESDVVIICYVRSNADGYVGFVDDPNRINVAHSRCRRELHIVGDLDTLRRGDRGEVFHRLARTIRRDGELIPLSNQLAEQLFSAL